MKGQVAVVADAIAALDKKAAAALIEKREMWSTISTIQSDITTSLARASYLEKEGFAVDPENVGALVKIQASFLRHLQAEEGKEVNNNNNDNNIFSRRNKGCFRGQRTSPSIELRTRSDPKKKKTIV